MLPAVNLAEGRLFAGEFRVQRLIAAGGMGAVYVVEQTRTQRLRALKVMHPELVGDARLRERFLQEASVGARIKSDHAVQVVGAGVDADTGVPWLAMELLEGADLGEVLKARGALPPAQGREIFAQLCHAVAAAHDAGVVHRDLKPQNIFLAASRREGVPYTVKVLDFGIAKLVAEAGGANVPTEALGTPTWMAPEQSVPGAGITAATDVWALGLLAYTLLTGRVYWRASRRKDTGPMHLLREIAFEPLGPASERAAEVGVAHLLPEGFDAWFARCVVLDVDARFPTAKEARAGFDALIPPQGVSSDEGAALLAAALGREGEAPGSPPESRETPSVRVEPTRRASEPSPSRRSSQPSPPPPAVVARRSPTPPRPATEARPKSADLCPHIETCALFPRFAHSAFLRVWQMNYCESAYTTCERFRLSSAGKSVPLALLPNGKLLTLKGVKGS